MPDIGFESVGRGRPLAASVHDMEQVGPDRVFVPGQPRTEAALYGFRPPELPPGIEPLPVDLAPDHAPQARRADPGETFASSLPRTGFKPPIS